MTLRLFATVLVAGLACWLKQKSDNDVDNDNVFDEVIVNYVEDVANYDENTEDADTGVHESYFVESRPACEMEIFNSITLLAFAKECLVFPAAAIDCINNAVNVHSENWDPAYIYDIGIECTPDIPDDVRQIFRLNFALAVERNNIESHCGVNSTVSADPGNGDGVDGSPQNEQSLEVPEQLLSNSIYCNTDLSIVERKLRKLDEEYMNIQAEVVSGPAQEGLNKFHKLAAKIISPLDVYED